MYAHVSTYNFVLSKFKHCKYYSKVHLKFSIIYVQPFNPILRILYKGILITCLKLSLIRRYNDAAMTSKTEKADANSLKEVRMYTR